ncbi:MAG TPA: hypothetical protein VNO81_04140 [Candidatus Nitrosotenuis sp.]|jgi:type II secretory pathway pseudopilin PulG|nr:hypothetical protein [Candidatus Nitrosotenuis sp.]
MLRTRTGYSLIELMMGMGIFASAFLLLMGAFPTSASALHQAQSYMVASHLAEEEMAGIADRPFDQIASATRSVSMTSTNQGSQQTLTYTVQTTVTQPATYLKRVQVVVSWTIGRRTFQSALESNVADLD